jgi:hypothetical protein
MASLRSHRVHGDPKRKSFQAHTKSNVKLLGADLGLEVKARHCSCLKNCRPDRNLERLLGL